MSLFKIVTGLAGGLAAGLLLAKKSGKEFRKDLVGKTTEEKAEIFGKEILSIGKDLLEELKKLPENEQVEKLKILGKEKLENLSEEIKKSGVEKFEEAKEFGKSKLDELLPKIEKTLDEIKKSGNQKSEELKNFAGEKISDAKKIFKKEEEKKGIKMSKIFKK